MFAKVTDHVLLRTGTNVAPLAEQPNVSTLREWWEAQRPQIDNRASKQIEKGNEPYLFSIELNDTGMHPYVTAIDLQARAESSAHGERYGVELIRGTVWLPGDTVIAWR